MFWSSVAGGEWAVPGLSSRATDWRVVATGDSNATIKTTCPQGPSCRSGDSSSSSQSRGNGTGLSNSQPHVSTCPRSEAMFSTSICWLYGLDKSAMLPLYYTVTLKHPSGFSLSPPISQNSCNVNLFVSSLSYIRQPGTLGYKCAKGKTCASRLLSYSPV